MRRGVGSLRRGEGAWDRVKGRRRRRERRERRERGLGDGIVGMDG